MSKVREPIPNIKLPNLNDIPNQSIVFSAVNKESNNEILKLCNNGDIYHKGRLLSNDSEIVDGLKSLINESQKIYSYKIKLHYLMSALKLDLDFMELPQQEFEDYISEHHFYY